MTRDLHELHERRPRQRSDRARGHRRRRRPGVPDARRRPTSPHRREPPSGRRPPRASPLVVGGGRVVRRAAARAGPSAHAQPERVGPCHAHTDADVRPRRSRRSRCRASPPMPSATPDLIASATPGWVLLTYAGPVTAGDGADPEADVGAAHPPFAALVLASPEGERFHVVDLAAHQAPPGPLGGGIDRRRRHCPERGRLAELGHGGPAHGRGVDDDHGPDLGGTWAGPAPESGWSSTSPATTSSRRPPTWRTAPALSDRSAGGHGTRCRGLGGRPDGTSAVPPGTWSGRWGGRRPRAGRRVASPAIAIGCLFVAWSTRPSLVGCSEGDGDRPSHFRVDVSSTGRAPGPRARASVDRPPTSGRTRGVFPSATAGSRSSGPGRRRAGTLWRWRLRLARHGPRPAGRRPRPLREQVPGRRRRRTRAHRVDARLRGPGRAVVEPGQPDDWRVDRRLSGACLGDRRSRVDGLVRDGRRLRGRGSCAEFVAPGATKSAHDGAGGRTPDRVACPAARAQRRGHLCAVVTRFDDHVPPSVAQRQVRPLDDHGVVAPGVVVGPTQGAPAARPARPGRRARRTPGRHGSTAASTRSRTCALAASGARAGARRRAAYRCSSGDSMPRGRRSPRSSSSSARCRSRPRPAACRRMRPGRRPRRTASQTSATTSSSDVSSPHEVQHGDVDPD